MNLKQHQNRATGSAKTYPGNPLHNQEGKFLAKVALILTIALLIGLLSSPQWMATIFATPNQPEVATSAAKYDVDPYLIYAIIKAESNGEVLACSPAGARGLMQLMPDTAEWIAEQMNYDTFTVEHLNNPAVNIDMGSWYLAELSEEFDGNQVVVIAAYNAGRTNVRQWIASGTWDGTATHLDQIPYKETRDYVVRVQQNYRIYQGLYEK